LLARERLAFDSSSVIRATDTVNPANRDGGFKKLFRKFQDVYKAA
jgi:hypothetical protein